MTLKTILFASTVSVLAFSPGLYAQEQTTAQKVDAAAQEAKAKTEQAAVDAKASAEATAKDIENKLENEASAPAEAPAQAATEPTVEDPLIEQYRVRKDKNFKSVEFELAKELALHRSSVSLNEAEASLYSAALQTLTNAFGSVSEPQKEETYFEYQENPDTGEFVVVLVKDSYVKSARGDVCQIGTQVHLRTSVQAEFSAKLATLSPAPTNTEMSVQTETMPASTSTVTTPVAADVPENSSVVPFVPTKITEIECYNDQRPTYSQRLVQ